MDKLKQHIVTPTQWSLLLVLGFLLLGMLSVSPASASAAGLSGGASTGATGLTGGTQTNTGLTGGANDTPTSFQGGTAQLKNPLGDSTIIGFFNSIVDVLLVFAVPLIVFFIMYAGFLYVTARGNPTEITKAHKALLYALIGGVLILGAHALLLIISGTVSQFQ